MNLDRTLLQQAFSHRGLVLLVVGLILATGLLIVWQASLFTQVIQGVFLGGATRPVLSPVLRLLLGVILLRAGVGWAVELSASALSRRVRRSLRERLFTAVIDRGSAFTSGEQSGELAGVLVEGIESLDAYFSQYLPGLAAALLLPLIILIFIFPTDLLTGVIFLLTAPLIPLFMFLIGHTAQSFTRRQWQALSRLKAYFLDVLQGLATLKALGRSRDQVQVIQDASDKYRRITMGVLRVAFTSALALELVATLSTAVIAVQIGLRLLYGGLAFSQAFFVLLLAPEFYQPLRLLGARFHSGMAGVAAAQRIFDLIGEPGVINDQGQQKPQPVLSLTEDVKSNGAFREIRLQGVSFEYEEGRSALHGVSLKLERGQKVALVGPSGAGKSTVASLLLRFIAPTQGEILLDGVPLESTSTQGWRSQLAWVPQKPYIFPGTVLDNLRLSRPQASLEEVVEAARSAHAHEFIQALPGGYQALLEEAGAPLSAGQAQRLSLARAFLRNAPLLILDEVTASLDPQLEASLQDSLEKLLHGRTALIIAHRLNTITSADHIYVLLGGKVVQSGDHTSLLKQGGLYRSMVEAALHPAQPELSRRLPRSADSMMLPLFFPGYLPRPVSLLGDSGPEIEAKPTSGRLFRWLLGWIAPFIVALSLAALAGFATIASNMALMGASAYIISAAVLQPSIAVLQVAIVSVRLFGLSRGLFRYLERLLSHQATLRLLSSLRVRVYRALEPLSPARLQQYRSGDLLARLIGDIDSLEAFYVRGLAPPIVALLVALAGFIFLSLFSLQLAAVFLIGMGLSGLVLPLISHLAGRKASVQHVLDISQLNATLVDIFQGLPELELFGKIATRSAEVSGCSQSLDNSQKRMSLVNSFQTAMNGALANLCLWSTLFMAIPLVVGGQLQGVYLAALLLAVLVSFEAVAPLPQAAQHLKGDLASAGRLYELVDTSPQVVDPPSPPLPPKDSGLQVAGLSFRYPAAICSGKRTGATIPAENTWTICDISFSLPPGKRLALVGPSGSGKSTLVSLLLRFWEFDHGRILLGMRDLQDYTQQQVRSQFSVLLQNPYLFSASLLENIRLGDPQADQSQVDRAVELASLAEFVAGLPQGLQTWVGEQGVQLSAGERQRVAIARALLSSAPILVLDEPTAHLDAITERRIMANLLDSFPGRSLLLIMHRLVGMEAMDEILVLSAGQIVERGPHADLLVLDGHYRRMWDLQRQQLLG